MALTDRENPYLAEDRAARMSVSISCTVDLGTHLLFHRAGDRGAEEFSAQRPMTYADYCVLKKAGGMWAPGREAEKKEAKYVCSVCHYVYDGEIPLRNCRMTMSSLYLQTAPSPYL